MFCDSHTVFVVTATSPCEDPAVFTSASTIFRSLQGMSFHYSAKDADGSYALVSSRRKGQECNESRSSDSFASGSCLCQDMPRADSLHWASRHLLR